LNGVEDPDYYTNALKTLNAAVSCLRGNTHKINDIYVSGKVSTLIEIGKSQKPRSSSHSTKKGGEGFYRNLNKKSTSKP
jgi:hypothetical protein